jgi:hypothetical protein
MEHIEEMHHHLVSRETGDGGCHGLPLQDLDSRAIGEMEDVMEDVIAYLYKTWISTTTFSIESWSVHNLVASVSTTTLRAGTTWSALE